MSTIGLELSVVEPELLVNVVTIDLVKALFQVETTLGQVGGPKADPESQIANYYDE
jgi:hypothetical protein